MLQQARPETRNWDRKVIWKVFTKFTKELSSRVVFVTDHQVSFCYLSSGPLSSTRKISGSSHIHLLHTVYGQTTVTLVSASLTNCCQWVVYNLVVYLSTFVSNRFLSKVAKFKQIRCYPFCWLILKCLNNRLKAFCVLMSNIVPYFKELIDSYQLEDSTRKLFSDTHA